MAVSPVGPAEPPTVDLVLGPGETSDVTKTVRTPEVPATPDIVLLADTTGSMAGAIDNVRASATEIIDTIARVQPQARFGAAEYQDAGSPIAFRVNQELTADSSAVRGSLGQWVAGGGGDFPEDGLNALYQIANGAVSFRDGGTRIVALFGDAPSHDPSNGHSLADSIAALQRAQIRVVAVNLGGLDSGGQLTSIVEATDGVLLNGVPPNEVADAILAGIRAIEVTVTPIVTCDEGISLTFTPPTRTVPSGTDAVFTEHIHVGATTTAGVYGCTVDFPPDGKQTVRVVVPGLAIDDIQVDEAAGTAIFTVTMTVPSPDPVSVGFATSDGTADAPADFANSTGTVVFAPGETATTISIPIVSDTLDEPTETFTTTLSAASGAALVDGTGQASIVDDDPAGFFRCTAIGLNVAGFTAARANAAKLPCVDDSTTVPVSHRTMGLIAVRANNLTATTDLAPDNGGDALATAASGGLRITAPLLTIEVDAVSAWANVTCVSGPGGHVPSFRGTSTVSGVKVNGTAVAAGSAPSTIPLLIGTLRLNQTVSTPTGLVRRALMLDTLLADVVIGEVRVGVGGSPAHPTGTPCG